MLRKIDELGCDKGFDQSEQDIANLKFTNSPESNRQLRIEGVVLGDVDYILQSNDMADMDAYEMLSHCFTRYAQNIEEVCLYGCKSPYILRKTVSGCYNFRGECSIGANDEEAKEKEVAKLAKVSFCIQ